MRVETSRRMLIERPDYRRDGVYIFVKGYTGGGAEMCCHVTVAEAEANLTKAQGPGVLVDDGVDLWWEQKPENVKADGNHSKGG